MAYFSSFDYRAFLTKGYDYDGILAYISFLLVDHGMDGDGICFGVIAHVSNFRFIFLAFALILLVALPGSTFVL